MIAGAILAGGRSSRMGGGDKALALLSGETVLARIIARLAPQVGPLAINANGDAARFKSFALPVVADRLAVAKGPLGGLHASLEWARDGGADMLITVTADAPFLPRDLVGRLTTAGGCAIAASARQSHYAIGAWPVSLVPELESAILEGGMFRMQDWAARCGATVIAWAAESYDPFFNINTPDDLADAVRICDAFAP
jgi:molybdenum cofactor guanylyltransferase